MIALFPPYMSVSIEILLGLFLDGSAPASPLRCSAAYTQDSRTRLRWYFQLLKPAIIRFSYVAFRTPFCRDTKHGTEQAYKIKEHAHEHPR